MFDDENLTFDVETNDDDTEVALVVRSKDGTKISQHEFIMAVEMYLHQVTEAEIYRTTNNSPLH